MAEHDALFKRILAHLEVWAARFAEVLARHPDESEALLRYILLAAGERSLDEVQKSILLHIPAAEATMASAGEQLIQQGFQRGIQQGVQQGRLATLRETLSAQLDARFGASGPSVTAAIEAAQEQQLQRMLLRVTTAASVDDVLAAG